MTVAELAVVTFNQPPARPASLKYTHLAPVGIAALRRYAARHGYAVYDTAPPPDDRPACWGKITALASALERHAWAFWVDADAVVQPDAAPLAPLIPERGDLLCEDPASFLGWLGLDRETARRLQPVHTAVFGLRRSPWTHDLLAAAWARREWISKSIPWNGIGEQEAINAVLKRAPELAAGVRYVSDLQAPPALATRATRFVHFYGDRARPRWSEAASRRVLARYADDVAAGRASRQPLPLVHWSAIQATAASDAAPDRGGPEKFGYDAAMLDAAIRQLVAAA